jgi:lipopolysaccharide/colanic/teichoic acid biosynthesis glycosyltransferase
MKRTHRDWGPGKMFHSQVRVGKEGKGIVVTKFRTMREGSIRNHKLIPHPTKPGRIIKVSGEFTALGRMLRAMKADEWPQFLNFLRREMGLLGHRPLLTKDYFGLSKKERAMYRRMKPALIPLRLWGWTNNAEEVRRARILMVHWKLFKRGLKRGTKKTRQLMGLLS